MFCYKAVKVFVSSSRKISHDFVQHFSYGPHMMMLQYQLSC